MGNSKRYTEEIKPSKSRIIKVWQNYNELKNLLIKSKYKKGGFYILNENRWFTNNERSQYLFFEHEIKHPDSKENYCISTVQVKLSVNKKSQAVPNWVIRKYKPRNTYGIDALRKMKCTKDFNRGHIIADSIIEYTKDQFEPKKWQNFVMITDWCNRANTIELDKDELACGMFFFEKIILDTLKTDSKEKGDIPGIDIDDYRVTPVFKKIDKEKQEFEYLPRGIILEAKTKDGKEFKGENAEKFRKAFPDAELKDQFNVFIPNAQRGLEINYETGHVTRIKE